MFRTAYENGIPTSFDLNLRVDNGVLDPSYRDAVMEIIQYSNYVLGSGAEEFYYLNPRDSWEDSVRGLVRARPCHGSAHGQERLKGIFHGRRSGAPGVPCYGGGHVGAGDVYNAGFIAKRLEGGTLSQCLEYGNAVSGYTVERKGARSCPYPGMTWKHFWKDTGRNHER